MGLDWLNKKSLNWVWWIVDLPQKSKTVGLGRRWTVDGNPCNNTGDQANS
jgi:hypothetical protein